MPLLEQVQENPELLRLTVDLSELDVGLHQLVVDVQAPLGLIVELFPEKIQVLIE